MQEILIMSDDQLKNLPKEVIEGYDLLNYFYGFSKTDDPDQYLQKDSFRQDVYRLIVIQFHLTIEDLLKGFIYEAIIMTSKRKVFTDKQNIEYVQKLNSHSAIDLAARLGILTKLGHDELIRLNTIRNQCSHNWTLHAFTVPKAPKNTPKRRKYKVEFNGKNLLNPKVVKDEFIPLYSSVYLELFAVWYGIDDWKHKYTDSELKGSPTSKL